MRVRKSERWLIGGAVGAVILGGFVGILAFIASADHAAVGKWRNEIWSLIVYPDHRATLNSTSSTWASIDESTIRLTPKVSISIPGSPVKISAGVELDFRLDDSGRSGVLEIFGFPIEMGRVGAQSGANENRDGRPARVGAQGPGGEQPPYRR